VPDLHIVEAALDPAQITILHQMFAGMTRWVRLVKVLRGKSAGSCLPERRDVSARACE
jgi:hypothetical protein